MKKILVCLTGVICLLAAITFAAEKSATDANQSSAVKPVSVKTAKMNARGKVVEISDRAIKIERSIKGNVEIMEFALDAPAAGVAVNDSVKIAYSVKDGKLTASRVVKLGGVKSPGKDGTKQPEEKPASTAK